MPETDISKFIAEGNRDSHILFGSQSGNSEGLAEAWEQEATRYGLKGKVHDMDGFDIKSMAEMSRVMIVCSTWGEGEMPDNAEDLYEAATSAGKILSNTNFSICSLGDTGYDLFCQSGKDWDKTLEDIGGSRIHDRVDCDVDFEMPAEEWMKGAMSKLACVDNSGKFLPDLVDNMVDYAAGIEVEAPAETTEELVGGTTAYQAMTKTSLFLHKPNKWLTKINGNFDEEDITQTIITKQTKRYKERKNTHRQNNPP